MLLHLDNPASGREFRSSKLIYEKCCVRTHRARRLKFSLVFFEPYILMHKYGLFSLERLPPRAAFILRSTSLVLIIGSHIHNQPINQHLHPLTCSPYKNELSSLYFCMVPIKSRNIAFHGFFFQIFTYHYF